jgi:hypothetical protein
MRLFVRGFKYRSNDSVEVREIFNYGFNKESLISLVEGLDGQKYYIECVNNNGFKINVLNGNKAINLEKYKWIKIKNNEKQIRTIELSRNYSMFIFIALFFTFIYRTLKLRKMKRNG